MNNIPYKLHIVWLGPLPVPYDGHLQHSKDILGEGWQIVLWTRSNIPFDGVVLDSLNKLLDSGNLSMASLYYRVALLEKFAGYSLSYNTRLDKHLRPFNVFCAMAGGLMVAHKDPTYTGPDYIGTDILMCERIHKRYPNSTNMSKPYWSRRFCRYVESQLVNIQPSEIDSSTSLTTFLGNKRYSGRQVRTIVVDNEPLHRQDKPCRVRGVQLLSHKYFYDSECKDPSMGLVLPNLGY